ncbi:hypothetical protein J7I98_37995 [Streptomyces sp. ISL-98]|uniref:hypothetical protein n=1 Tax=Streptomyces sp. ISL-98 TaxID=2819192 RepID=UPI001BEB8FB1|nr:hypothetical protein [Streptomyces sp. ISL-98]MBT2511490.1 hypothetical protein [Streptomyces sp. ISL-98]
MNHKRTSKNRPKWLAASGAAAVVAAVALSPVGFANEPASTPRGAAEAQAEVDCEPGADSKPGGAKPAPVEPAPAEPDATEPESVEPAPAETAPAEPDVTVPESVEADAAVPDAVEPESAEADGLLSGAADCASDPKYGEWTGGDPSGRKPGRQGRALDFNSGPGAPSAGYPGAALSKSLYLKIARMDNASFVEMRNRVLQLDPADPVNARLQRSFYANGCTGVPMRAVSQQTLDACLQHDFRYTVGPNVMTGPAVKADRDAANRQLGENIGGKTGTVAEYLTWAVGSWFYEPTPQAGRVISGIFGVAGERGSGRVPR